MLASTQRIKEIINEEKQEVAGSLKIGIIPTLAPYLLPIFIGDYIRRYPWGTGGSGRINFGRDYPTIET